MQNQKKASSSSSSDAPANSNEQAKKNRFRLSKVTKPVGKVGSAVVGTGLGFWASFYQFIDKGNVVDLAVAIILGAAFTAVVTSFVQDILTPILGILPKKNFPDLLYVISPRPNNITSLKDAQQQGANFIAYGNFLQACFNCILTALTLWFIVQLCRILMRKKEAEKTTTECQFCQEKISLKATRCPHCTSQLVEEVPMNLRSEQDMKRYT